MKLRDLIWPWSTIRELQKQLDLEREFGDACLFYLNDHDGKTLEIQFIRFNGKLYFMDAAATYRVDRKKPDMPGTNVRITKVSVPE